VLGLSFWKYASGEKTAEADSGSSVVRRRQRRVQKLKILVLTGAALAAFAIIIGLPLIGLSMYLLTTLPFILFAS
jgi:hypothetical protein